LKYFEDVEWWPWNLPLLSALVLCLARFWLMPLFSSYWVDEMATLFVVRQGASDPSFAVAPQVPQSLYYVLAALAGHLFGYGEAAMRVPSLLAMGGALFFIARLAARLIHPAAAWFAVFGCLSLRGINYQAADARPYAVGSCVAAAGLWFLVCWFDSGRWRDASLFMLCGALLWRIHLIYWPFYLVFAAYAVARIGFRETGVTWRQALGVFTVLALALVPVAWNALALLRQAGMHVIVALPTVRNLILAIKIGFVATCGAAAFLLHCAFRFRRDGWTLLPPDARLVSPASLTLIGCWWLCQPLCLYLFSWLTGNSVFLGRYEAIALPGAVLAAAAVAAPFVADAHWKPLALALGLGLLVVLGGWRTAWPRHDISDWRLAVRSSSRLGLDPATPVIAPSPFIEARPPVWRPDYPLSSFLYSHLQVYRPQGRLYPFPFETSPQAERFAAQLARQTLAPSGRFLIYGSACASEFWRKWFAARPEFAGWRSNRLGPFGDVDVVVFENPANRTMLARH
jgi:mannosyltransferase